MRDVRRPDQAAAAVSTSTGGKTPAPNEDEVAAAYDVTIAMLAVRAPTATVCPSEVARAVVYDPRVAAPPEEWRGAMPAVHAAVDRLLGIGRVRLSWRGKALATRSGPYRIGRGSAG